MDKKKADKLRAAGWQIGSATEFLEMPEKEVAALDLGRLPVGLQQQFAPNLDDSRHELHYHNYLC